MTYRSTQIYLKPAQHEALKDEARHRDVSMAELLRQIVSDHMQRQSGTDLSALVGLVKGGPTTDIARDKQLLIAEAASKLHGSG